MASSAEFPHTIRLAVSSVIWANPSGDQFRPWLREVKSIGYQGITGFADWGWEDYIAQPAIFRSWIEEAGLELASMIVGLKPDFDLYRRTCEFMAEQGSKHLTCIGGRGRQDRDFAALGDLLNHIGEITKSHGVHLSYHHHTDTSGETREDMDQLLSHTSVENVYVMCDTGHATKDFIHQPVQERAIAFMARYWDRLDFVEFKDWNIRTDLNTPIGEGLCDFPAVIRLLQRNNYSGWIVVEQNSAEEWSLGRPPGQCAQISYDYIRRCLQDC